MNRKINCQARAMAVALTISGCWASASAQQSTETHPQQPASAGQAATSDSVALLAQGETTFDPAVAATLEIKRAKAGHLLCRPKIDGRDAGWFIFDTGAGVCVISTPYVDQFDLTRRGDIHTSGVGGGKTEPMYGAKELRLGPMILSDHPMMATDLTFLDVHMGEKIVGVIGFGVLTGCVAEIDVAAPSVALHDPRAYKLARGEWISADLNDRVPVVKAKFEGHEGCFRLDTGDHAAITFHEPAVRKWNLLDGRDVSDAKLGGVGGFVAAKKGRIAWLELGGVRVDDVIASFAIEPKGNFAQADKDGNIGTGILDRFIIVTDYARSRLALAPK